MDVVFPLAAQPTFRFTSGSPVTSSTPATLGGANFSAGGTSKSAGLEAKVDVTNQLKVKCRRTRARTDNSEVRVCAAGFSTRP